LFERDEVQAQTPGQPLLLETRSPADEAREALRWIKAQVVREGLPLSECAVFTPNPDIYNPFLRSAAAEFGIPVHFTQSIPLKDSPAIAALLNLLGLPAENFRSRLLFNTLRSPYFELGLDTGTVDALEEISRVARIAEGRQAWQATWERLIPSEYTDQADLDEERSLPGLPRGEQAKGLRQALDAVFELFVIPEQSQSQTAWVAWLEDLLERLNYYQNTGLERDQAACETLRETLRALVLSESVLGVRSIDYTDFLTGLQNTLNGVGLPEIRLKDGAALLVGNIVEARGLRFQAVALLGFSEGLFPQVERPDPFLDEALRHSLGMDARLNREQAGLFYQAVTRADHSLLLTRPYLSDDGEAWEASPYWKDAARRFTPDACRRIRPEDAHSLFDAASSQEVLFRVALNDQAEPVESLPNGRMPEAFADLAGRWDAIRQGGGVLSARRGRKPQGDYEGYTPHLQAELAARYAPEQVWSASRLEAYGNCPHQFFIKNALGLEARVLPEPGMEVTQLGSLLHEILELVYQQAADPGDLDSVLTVLPEVAAQSFESAPEKYGFSPSAAWDFEQANFLSILSETIIALHKASQGWTPSAYEAKFGIQGQPVLEIDLGEETLRLRGVIDRLDKNERGEIRVMDYKTGGSHLSGDDLLRGTRLQLPIYALAARDALGLGDVSEGFYWEIKGAKAGSLKLSRFKTRQSEGVDEAIRVAVEHLRRIVYGIRSGTFPPVPPKGGCPSYCPAAQWCWRYQPGFGGGK
jgi:ATP-dependent helicase/nuclease subunit B